ncbi:hypothetical protein EAE99_005999 [Botrytis elliptica]|nr:hypothetical protein EAE99_005999 [Botrytis elliptica]
MSNLKGPPLIGSKTTIVKNNAVLVIFVNKETHALATDAIRHTVKEGALAGTNDFVGPPSDASWKAWLDLVPLSLIQISHEETVIAKEDPEHSVEVDEDGYMGSLVFIMSCTRRLKLYLYKEHYYPTIESTPAEKEREVMHLDHCIDAIRQSIICSGNTVLYSFQWERNGTRKPRTKTNGACLRRF